MSEKIVIDSFEVTGDGENWTVHFAISSDSGTRVSVSHLAERVGNQIDSDQLRRQAVDQAVRVLQAVQE